MLGQSYTCISDCSMFSCVFSGVILQCISDCSMFSSVFSVVILQCISDCYQSGRVVRRCYSSIDEEIVL